MIICKYIFLFSGKVVFLIYAPNQKVCMCLHHLVYQKNCANQESMNE